ncbi:CROCC family protein [Megaselia abdita]
MNNRTYKDLSTKNKYSTKRPNLTDIAKKKTPSLNNIKSGLKQNKMSSPTPSENAGLIRQNFELRQRLQDESNSYRRRIDTYKQAQQNQANLVSRLQSKVVQYKQRCADLEDKMHEFPKISLTNPPISTKYLANNSIDPLCNSVSSVDLCSLPHLTSVANHHHSPPSLPCVQALEASTQPNCSQHSEICEEIEKQREQLLKQNSIFRQQLEESNKTNEALTNDLQKLTNDWEILRDELVLKEDEFKEEEQAFNDFCNNEHDRLLEIWREVKTVKRAYEEMTIALKVELNNAKFEVDNANRDIATATNNVLFNNKVQLKQKKDIITEQEKELANLRKNIENLNNKFDKATNEIHKRDIRLQELTSQVKLLEDRCSSAENQAIHTNSLSEELELLNNAMKDIAHAIVLDAEVSTKDGINNDVLQNSHLSQRSLSRSKSPRRRSSSRNRQAFAEGTISAVQATLQKYQLMLHDFQVKFNSINDCLNNSKKQLKNSEDCKALLTTQVQKLIEKLDSCNSQLVELSKEREYLLKILEKTRDEKHKSDKAFADLSSAFDNLSSDFEKLQNANAKLRKTIDLLEEDKKSIELEMQNLLEDKDILNLNLRAEEDRGSKLREETITLREELNKICLTNDLLDQQRIELENVIEALEKSKSDLESNLEKLEKERTNLQSHVDNLSCNNSNASNEIKNVHDKLSKCDEDRNTLTTICAQQKHEIHLLKKELHTLQSLGTDYENERLVINEKIKVLESESEKLKQDLTCVTRDRDNFHDQLTIVSRKQEMLNEESLRLRQRLDQSNETNNRLNKNLEDLYKESEEKQCLLDAHDKEIQRLQENLAALRTEKESLEAVLFDTNSSLENIEEKWSKLDKERQELILSKESLKNQITRLTKDLANLNNKSTEMKAEFVKSAQAQEEKFNETISQLKNSTQANIRKVNGEKEELKMFLEKRMHQALQTLQNTKDEEIEKLQEEIERIQNQMDLANQQHEENLIRTENEKQQSLLMAHRDKQAVLEKMDCLTRQLKQDQESFEKLKREFNLKEEKHRNIINHLKDEMASTRIKNDEIRAKLEEDINKKNLAFKTIIEERENLIKYRDELKMELRLKEDKVESLNSHLQETLQKNKDNENIIDGIRKELLDLKRSYADCNIEKDKYANSNKELRDHVKRIELAKRELGRSIDEASQKNASLEEIKNGLENEKTRLSTILRETETKIISKDKELSEIKGQLQKLQLDNSQQNADGKDLKAKYNATMEENGKIQNELNQLKKQLSDVEAMLCATRQESGRIRCQTNQEEHRYRAKQQELCTRLEEYRNKEKRLEDQKHNLEVCLADATQQIQELKARIGGSESRIRVLDEQLHCMESIKRDNENKLNSIAHTLKRIAGIQFDGSVNLSYRLTSPSRRYSPVRGCEFDNRSQCPEGPLDIDPEIIKKGIRCLMHQIAQIERDRDDFKGQLCNAKKQLHDAAEQQLKCDSKVSKLQQHLRSLQEEKSNLEAKLNMKINACKALGEALNKKSDELGQIQDKVNAQDSEINNIIEQKALCEERLEKSRSVTAKLENEKRQLQEELARLEGKASKLDLQRVALEGDLQRLQMAYQEKDGKILQLNERFENQTRTANNLEERCLSLKTTIDNLKEKLQKSSTVEHDLRTELKSLNKEHKEQAHIIQSNSDMLKNLQKQLQVIENEKRLTTERLEAAQGNVASLKRNQHSQQDLNQRLQNQLSELEIQKSAMESKFRNMQTIEQNFNKDDDFNQQNGDKELSKQLMTIQRERSLLKNQLEILKDKVKLLEETNVSKFSGNGNGFDKPEKGQYSSNLGTGSYLKSNISCGLDHSAIEEENRNLRMKVRRMETLLAEKEAELARAKSRLLESTNSSSDSNKYRRASLHAEKVLDAREEAHRQQVLRLENQISMLREQLAQENKRRQQYISKSSKANREMQHLRNTLGDSLRHVSEDPLDTFVLENETKR